MLTPEQRYRQAILKARLAVRRNMRAWLDGRSDCTGEPTMDMERRFIIAEIAKAQRSGLRNGMEYALRIFNSALARQPKEESA